MPVNGNKRRCTATAAWTGQRCRKWALREGKRPLCSGHANQRFVGPEERRCTATRTDGERCRNWTMAPGEGERPARLCNVHAGEISHGPPPERRCTALRADGRRCRRWTTKGDEENPTLCYAHAYPEKGNLLRHGFYRRLMALSEEERAKIRAHVEAERPALAEVLVVRLKIQRLLPYLERPEVEGAARREAIRLGFVACLAVGELMWGRRRIGPERTGFARHLVARTVGDVAAGAGGGGR